MLRVAEINTAAVQLLEQAKIILDTREKVLKPATENFNMFSILNMETNEVDTHSRMLFELLSPSGSHGKGDRFLREFFELVLHKPFRENAVVYREYKIDEADNYGRIDLLVDGEGFCYPIEVKIYAGDQHQQIKRYAQFAAKAQDSQVYYLTLDGHEPSEKSTGGADNFACLSFGEHIRPWLVRCREISWQTPGVAETIQQYIHLVDKLTQSSEGDPFMEIIQKTVGMSQVNYKAATAIERTLEPLRAEMMRRVFREIEAHIGNRLQKYNSSYEADAEHFYSSNRKKVWPSLTYLVKRCGDLNVAFRTEADWEGKLSCGFVFFDDNYAQVPGRAKELIDAFESEEWRELISTYTFKDWWLWWDYLPEEPISFKALDGVYPELYDAKRHGEIMAEVFSKIDQLLDNSLETGWCGGTF